jgi:hypothetical protein
MRKRPPQRPIRPATAAPALEGRSGRREAREMPRHCKKEQLRRWFQRSRRRAEGGGQRAVGRRRRRRRRMDPSRSKVRDHTWAVHIGRTLQNATRDYSFCETSDPHAVAGVDVGPGGLSIVLHSLSGHRYFSPSLLGTPDFTLSCGGRTLVMCWGASLPLK